MLQVVHNGEPFLDKTPILFRPLENTRANRIFRPTRVYKFARLFIRIELLQFLKTLYTYYMVLRKVNLEIEK